MTLSNIDALPVNKSETNIESREKLIKFREFASQKLVKYWNNEYELSSVVSRSIIQLIKTTPMPGWIKADRLPNMRKKDNSIIRCSFCNKTQAQVYKLIAGPNGVYICDERIDICSDITTEEREKIKKNQKKNNS